MNYLLAMNPPLRNVATVALYNSVLKACNSSRGLNNVRVVLLSGDCIPANRIVRDQRACK